MINEEKLRSSKYLRKDSMKRLMNILSKNVDKVLHFLVTYAVTVSFIAYGYWLAGVVLSVILSIAKELLDQYLYKGFSWGDILADAAGIAGALIFCLGIIM